MTTKRQRTKAGISMFSEEEENCKSNTRDKKNQDQVDDEYPLPL